MVVPIRHLAYCPEGGMLSRCSHAFLSPEFKTGEWNRMWGFNMEELSCSDIVPSGKQAGTCLLSTSTENSP